MSESNCLMIIHSMTDNFKKRQSLTKLFFVNLSYKFIKKEKFREMIENLNAMHPVYPDIVCILSQ